MGPCRTCRHYPCICEAIKEAGFIQPEIVERQRKIKILENEISELMKNQRLIIERAKKATI